jgi:hypothetical protein
MIRPRSRTLTFNGPKYDEQTKRIVTHRSAARAVAGRCELQGFNLPVFRGGFPIRASMHNWEEGTERSA